MSNHLWIVLALIFVLTTVCASQAAPLTVDASASTPAPKSDGFKMGTSRNPDGREITVNSMTLLRNGRPWLPVMGEFHFARYPASEWRDELLKMKAGGISVVSTYVFWIHHEEEEGKWDWTGQRSLRNFVLTCKEVGLPVIVRAGPWCHGEVRNGGLPEWIISMGRQLRSQDPAFLAKVKILYGQVAEQLKGLLWKDGGPVIGMQFDNEFGGQAAYLLDLKHLAQELGMDLPIYTRTGWPNLRSPLPVGEMLPLYGAYSEGFWDRNTSIMPGKYWFAFVFSTIRSDASIGTDVLGEREQRDDADAAQYPFLSCELGGGMMTSYHRRILIDPRDVESVALVKTGSGSNLPGYYMYHGGANPEGKLTTLMETQSSKYTNSNDMPTKTYDFQAPLGEFGQLRPHYHGLRKLHLMLADWGSELAMMPAFVPAGAQHKNDANTVRWAVRTNGTSGFLFVNNYQRLLPMPAKPDTQFQIKLPLQTMNVPAEPITIPADSYFVWPFNLDLAGAKLSYATAQPICVANEEDATYYFFAQTKGVPADFLFGDTTHRLTPSTQGWTPALTVKTSDGRRVAIVLLDEPTSRALWKGFVGGRERVFISRGSLLFDGDKLRVRGSSADEMAVRVFENGEFRSLDVETKQGTVPAVAIEQIKQAGAPREIKNGVARVPEAPTDADFEQLAAVWRVKLPNGVEPTRDLLVRIHYKGDVARLYLDDKLADDNFYNGREFDFGLKRFGPSVYQKEILLKILPLTRDAPIYLADEAKPNFGTDSAVVNVSKVELIEQREAAISIK